MKPPEARTCYEHGIIVHRTHDVELATELARRLLADDYDDSELPPPIRTWLRVTPCRPDHPEGWTYTYDRAEPGQRGAFAAVEFPDEGRAIGTRVVS